MAEDRFQTSPKGLDPVALGLAIRERRKVAKMTQEVTAALCGISKKTLIKIEKGGDVYFSTLLRVMNALGMSLQLAADNQATQAGFHAGDIIQQWAIEAPYMTPPHGHSINEPGTSTDKPAGGDDEWF